jgi:hypothetical protein
MGQPEVGPGRRAGHHGSERADLVSGGVKLRAGFHLHGPLPCGADSARSSAPSDWPGCPASRQTGKSAGPTSPPDPARDGNPTARVGTCPSGHRRARRPDDTRLPGLVKSTGDSGPESPGCFPGRRCARWLWPLTTPKEGRCCRAAFFTFLSRRECAAGRGGYRRWRCSCSGPMRLGSSS